MRDDPASAAGPDRRVPVVTLLPQIAAVFSLAGDPEAARLAFVLAVAVDVPLHVAGAWDVRRPGIGWRRPAAALAWAVGCAALAPLLPTGSAPAAWRAAVSSTVIAVLLHVVPGGWTWDGWRLSARRSFGLPVARDYAVATIRRGLPFLLVAALGLVAVAPFAAAVSGAAVTLALLVEHRLIRRPAPPRDANERITRP